MKKGKEEYTANEGKNEEKKIERSISFMHAYIQQLNKRQGQEKHFLRKPAIKSTTKFSQVDLGHCLHTFCVKGKEVSQTIDSTECQSED
mmetsp:Transcript_25732/g.50391  ORF Transcript_25732/g.50391 Transcript_25732/m.50391 type:complete len:89 (+) Transcript_25732:770-1036(+)